MRRPFTYLIFASLAVLWGCTGSNSPNPIVLALIPGSSQTISQGGTVSITAMVAYDGANRGVTWRLSPTAAAGTLTASTAARVTYNAPATVASPATVTVTATSVSNPSISASLQITVQPGVQPGVAVSLTPGSLQTIKQGVSLGVTASVANDSNNRGVTWSLSPSSGAGMLSSMTATSVNYNAPSSVSGDVTATLTATSVADPTKSASLPITIQTAQSAQALNLVIRNMNSAYQDSQVYFTFRDKPVQGTINGQPIVLGNVYSLNDIGSGIQLQSAGGRIYFSLGAPLPISTGDPEPVNPQIDSWGVRFDKIELTYDVTNLNSVADLTSIDYFGIPLALQTFAPNGSTPLQALTFSQPTNVVSATLAALAPAGTQVLLTSNGSYLRVLGPQLMQANATKSAPNPYPSLQSYVNEFSTAGGVATIQDLFDGNSSGGFTNNFLQQCYNFTTSFDGNGNLHLNGGGTVVGQQHEIVIQASDLGPGIYWANPPYTVDGAASNIGVNDVYAAVVRDVLAGFGFGFINSSTIDPNTIKPFNTEPSAYWWHSPHAFNFLQTAQPNYNQYAYYLYTISNAYGQPFSDRWQTVQVALTYPQVATMEIDVLPDTGQMPVQSVNAAGAPPALNCVSPP